MFGIMDSKGNPLLLGVKVVPQFPLNLFYGTDDLPLGIFTALTKKDKVERKDFTSGAAQFVFVPA